MPKQVYYDLRQQLDEYAVGFPTTESGVEMEILERLFSEDEAELYLNLSMMLETAESIAQRLGRDVDWVSSSLERMVDKGLIFRLNKGQPSKYGAVPFLPGSFDFQIKAMDRDLAELFDTYLIEGLGRTGISKSPPLRTIPVNQSIGHLWPVAPYEDVKEIIKSKETVSVANCICRVQQGLLNKGCRKPVEVCFQFGSNAQYYVDKGMARFITRDYALEIIDQCEESGLVPQPFLAQDAGAMCNCCGDCCQILRSIKMDPKPAEKVLTNYYAAVDPDACSACETCTDRCQMEAIKLGAANVAEIDRDRCIGCGLCVTKCPGKAISLRRKPESECRVPPVSSQVYLMQLASSRGKSLVPLSVQKKWQRRS